jgi:WD40 repeat protein
LQGHANVIAKGDFSPAGQILSCSADKTAKIWDISFADKEPMGHQKPITCLSFSPDGKLLASASHDKTVKVWSTETGKCIKTIRGHTATIRTCAFSPDGQFIGTGSVNRLIIVLMS